MNSSGQTVSEAILSAHAGRPVRAGEIAVCNVDFVLGTDAATPMAIDYFEQMGGDRVFDPARIMFALDHYAPPATPQTRAFHDRMRAFAGRYGIELWEAGRGISHQLLVESGRLKAGDLVIGADSHTVTCGALGLFATGVGSSDLAAAMLTGQVWLRVPETIEVVLKGRRAAGIAAKDIALALLAEIGPDGANYQALEFRGPAADALSRDERMVLCNLAVEMDAKAAIFPDAPSERGARVTRRVALDISRLTPRIALPHAPHNVAELVTAAGTPVQMVFVGTCTGGRASDLHEFMEAFDSAGGRIAKGVEVVVTPASRKVEEDLKADGTLQRLVQAGVTVTTAGCGACCGTSGVIPRDGMTVLSTANRNFKGRMGNRTASIYLASPATCGAAAATGRIGS